MPRKPWMYLAAMHCHIIQHGNITSYSCLNNDKNYLLNNVWAVLIKIFVWTFQRISRS